MAAGGHPRTSAGGGERIPALRPARPARLAIALAAIALFVALASLVISDAGTASGLAWLGAGLAAVFLTIGAAAESAAPVHAAVALLGAIFLLRHDTRLLLAPAYGAGLLLMDDLAIRTMELSGVGRIAPGLISARVGATLAVAAVGVCLAAIAALAVTGAPGRSVWLTAIGALAAVAAIAAVVRLARTQFGGAHNDS